MNNTEQDQNENRKFIWSLIIVLPIIWGLIGLVEGKGFLPYIVENIKALIILGIGFFALLGVLVFMSKK